MSQSFDRAEALIHRINALAEKSVQAMERNKQLSQELQNRHYKMIEEENRIDELATIYENNNIYLQHLTSLTLRSELFDSQLNTFEENSKSTASNTTANKASLLEISLNWRTTETTFDNLCLEYEYLTEQLRVANDCAYNGNLYQNQVDDSMMNHTSELDDTYNSTSDSLFSSNDHSNTTVSSKNSNFASAVEANILDQLQRQHRKKHVLKKDSFLQIPFSASIKPVNLSQVKAKDNIQLKSFHIDTKKLRERNEARAPLKSRPIFPPIIETLTSKDELQEDELLGDGLNGMNILHNIHTPFVLPTIKADSLYDAETPVDKVDMECIRNSSSDESLRESSSKLQNLTSMINSLENNSMDMETSSPNQTKIKTELLSSSMLSNDTNTEYIEGNTESVMHSHESSDEVSLLQSNRNSTYSENSYGDPDAEPFNLDDIIFAAEQKDYTDSPATITGQQHTDLYRSKSHESIFSMAPTLTQSVSSLNQVSTPTTMYSSSSILDRDMKEDERKAQTMKWLKFNDKSYSTPIIETQQSSVTNFSSPSTRNVFPNKKINPKTLNVLSSSFTQLDTPKSSSSRSSKEILNSVSTSDKFNRIWLSSPFALAYKKQDESSASLPTPLPPSAGSSKLRTEITIDSVTSGSKIVSLPDPISILKKTHTRDTDSFSMNSFSESKISNQWTSFVSQLIPDSSMVYSETGKFVGKPCCSTSFGNTLDPYDCIPQPGMGIKNYYEPEHPSSAYLNRTSVFKKANKNPNKMGSFSGSHSTLYLGTHGSKIVRHGGDSMSQSVLSSRVSHAALRDALRSSFN